MKTREIRIIFDDGDFKNHTAHEGQHISIKSKSSGDIGLEVEIWESGKIVEKFDCVEVQF